MGNSATRWADASFAWASGSALVPLLLAAGCSPEPEGLVVVANAEATADAPTSTTQPPRPALPPSNVTYANGDRIERSSPPPVTDTSPPKLSGVRKDFVDPPLPAELNEDGGLIPLPPPRRQ